MGRHDLALPGALPVPPWQRNSATVDAADILRLETDARELRRALERQKRTFDLAMAASRMGAWRYTLADNVCVYDENAQRLYGLADARFVHDVEGVKSKFHPD